MLTKTYARAELQKGIEYLWNNQYIWNEPRQLKPYKAFHKACDLDKVEEYYSFCEWSYFDFEELAKAKGVDLETMKYIGRTSTFYLTDLCEYGRNYYTKGDIVRNALNNLLDEISGNLWYDPRTYLNYNIDKAGNIHITWIDEDYEETAIIDDLNNILKLTKEYLAEAKWIADYVDDFLEHSEEYFLESLTLDEKEPAEEGVYFVGEMESESFSWIALGTTEEETKGAIKEAWNRNQQSLEQHGYTPYYFNTIEELEEEYDITITKLAPGSCEWR